jgi:hypothetical protein
MKLSGEKSSQNIFDVENAFNKCKVYFYAKHDVSMWKVCLIQKLI